MTDSVLTVITPASQDLVTLAELRDELGNPPAADDAHLRRVISRVSAAIGSYCGRVFVRETVSEAFVFQDHLGHRGHGYNGHHTPSITLRRYPIGSVDTITRDGTALVLGKDYDIDAERGQLVHLSGGYHMPWFYRTLIVQYTGGYPANAIPPDLADAALLLATARYASRGRDPAMRQYSVPGVLEEQFWVNTTNNLPPDIVSLLSPYRELRS